METLTQIRYAQCWEDADVLASALAVEPHHTCLAIASAGDNALALLAGSPHRVIAIDFNPAQLACLELRVAAYRALDDDALLCFAGARASANRTALYGRCRPHLSASAKAFWDARPGSIARGFYSEGKLERYLRLFRTRVLPLIHGKERVAALLRPKSRAEREEFFDRVWDNRRWRALCAAFFSRPVMGRLGRDARFFDYARADVAAHLLQRVRHAFVELDPAENPYVHWILTGRFGPALPFSLRPENTAAIRRNLDRLTWECTSLETLVTRGSEPIDRFALSDVFEYMSEPQYAATLRAVAASAAPGARLVYWNMLVPRSRPAALARTLVPDEARARMLHRADKVPFYSRLVIEDKP